jgi:hypothetical protein
VALEIAAMSLPVPASTATLPASPAGVPAPRWPWRVRPARPTPRVVRQVIRKRGMLAPLLAPIGVAIALLIIGIPAIAIWNIHSASEARRALHEAAVPADATALTVPVKRQVQDGEAEFVLRLIDGKLVRVIASKDEAGQFINRTLVRLDEARTAAHASAAAGLDAVFAQAFATRQADLSAYADWFYEWGRSWRFLYEALAGAAQEAARLSFSQTQITDAARQAVEAYLLRHYEDVVLKPGLRDPVIVAGINRVLKEAHDRYLTAVAGLDDDMQKFLAEKTRYAEEIPGDGVAVKIDWDASKWKAPRYSAEDRYLEPIGSAAIIGGSAVLGSMVERVIIPFFARATAQVMASSELTIGGAAAGSFSPGVGTAIGALAGAALDWGLSRFRDYMERDDFIADNSAALDASIATWKGRIQPEIDRAIDVWFDDTRATVASR